MDSFDVIVIGGGPAGMMAAARAARCGAKVLLLDKNKELGRKLMLTGRGRCNFAHDEPDVERLAEAYGDGSTFIKPALEAFGLESTLNFFARRGVKVAHERGKRIYPADDQDAGTLLQALRRELRDGGVLILGATEVRSLDIMGGKARRVMTHRGEINGRAFVIATGGMSFSMTGCSGDGYRWARKAGCSVVEPRPAICPIKVSEGFCADMGALKLKNVRLTLIHQGEEVATRFGEMDFAPFGISAATAMDLADTIGQCLTKGGSLSLSIDLKPALDLERLDMRIERDFDAIGETPLRFALRKMLPKELIPVILRRCGLDEGLPCGQTPQEKREALRDAIKNFTVTPTGLMGFRFAIVTAGGVSCDDVDPATMAARKVSNLFFAGEVLDIDGPTGGYNLQACWSTGVLAGQSAALQLGFQVPPEEPPVTQTAPEKPVGETRRERPAMPRRAEGREFPERKRREDRSTFRKERTPSEGRKDRPTYRKDGTATERREDRPTFRKEGPAGRQDNPSRNSQRGAKADKPWRRDKGTSQNSRSENRDSAPSYKNDEAKAPRRDRPQPQDGTRKKPFASKTGPSRGDRPVRDKATASPCNEKPKTNNKKKERPSNRSATSDFAGWKGFGRKKDSSAPRSSKKEE